MMIQGVTYDDLGRVNRPLKKSIEMGLTSAQLCKVRGMWHMFGFIPSGNPATYDNEIDAWSDKIEDMGGRIYRIEENFEQLGKTYVRYIYVVEDQSAHNEAQLRAKRLQNAENRGRFII